MNNAMIAMGWGVFTYHGFILANVVIFAAYAILGWRHFQRFDDTLEHSSYGMFIIACGLGHLTMAANMFLSVPILLFVTHAFTAFVSMKIAVEYKDE